VASGRTIGLQSRRGYLSIHLPLCALQERAPMDFAVLIKVVPDVERLQYDPQRKTMIREGNELFINPFDQRAIRVALDTRRPGEHVTVISMSPPAAEAALQETLALGADRAILLSDSRLAGSDTAVTAQALTAVLRRVSRDMIFTGAWSVDSDTGQVGPEIAGLLDLPFVGGVRKLDRAATGDGWEVTADTPTGWVRLRTEPPVVFSVTEKITKIRKPTSAEIIAAASREVEHWTVDTLGLDPNTIGLEGSPTVVAALVNEEPTRHSMIISMGTLEERVAEATRAADQLLETTGVPSFPPTVRHDQGNDQQEILVLVSGPDGRSDPATLPFLSEVRRSLPDHWPSAVWIGQEPDASDRIQAVRAGAGHGYYVSVPGDFIPSHIAARALGSVLQRRPRVAGVVFSAEPFFGREVASRIAARKGLGLTGDAVGMKYGDSKSIRWRKPAFGGGIIAEIHSRTRPSLVTLRPGSFEPATGEATDSLAITKLEGVPGDRAVEWVDSGRERDAGWGDLSSAPMVVCVGMGIGGPENLPLIRSSLEGTPFALAATRRVVDAGWVPRQLQVGLTGRSLAPEVALLVGIGGSKNHLIGWRRARCLVALNPDPQAPVFRGVDVGIVATWQEALLPLIRALAVHRRAG
jgi:electron transfer flavoprotein alpha subunit